MKSVIKGWQKETDELVNDKNRSLWTKDRQKSYMDRQKTLEIVSNTEGLGSDNLKKRLREFKLKKRKRAK